MRVIEVQSPGLFTTVQDLGRDGFGSLGVSPSGAADPISLRLGNRLVGNPENAAALEMTLLGGAFHFPEPAIAALTGSDFGATLDESPVGLWASFEVRGGQTLRLGPTRTGARCYLCVHGGIEVKLFLGSASTHILSGLGGLEGRALKKGDVLKIRPATGAFRTRTIAPSATTGEAARLSFDPVRTNSVNLSDDKVGAPCCHSSADKVSAFLRFWSAALAPRKILRVTRGPQSDWFSESSLAAFYDCTYRVTEDSNRMGLRLEGTAIDGQVGGHMISEGVSLGAIQVPAGGQPIILFVEQQTAGGYPKIANVISADLAGVGQLRPRDEIRFELVGLETARSLLRQQEELLRELILE